eukprot:CAMPEP_0172079728 /NCGR_PEP_ID=MMETSP1043-20130122/18335_1 /TAXON_ID=464988 /ORGANISM="Hemiselmis andersenii, Strain CCMP441" /LENGTH=54 /DNA_ID=CAMNT_0012740945 /DNA_START=290 /DNA_END=450 /DNA_ORIENTATION=-
MADHVAELAEARKKLRGQVQAPRGEAFGRCCPGDVSSRAPRTAAHGAVVVKRDS